MDNKSLKISGTVELQTKQAEEAMKKIVKQFQGVDKNSFNKLNEDFRKLSPLIKELDKGLFKMMNTMSKKDAREQLNLMNKALKDQAALIKDNIKQFEDLTKQIEETGDATGELGKKRSGLVAEKRALMTSMETHGERRNEAKEALGGGIGPAKLIAAAVGVEVASKVAQSLVTHFSGREMRKQGYEAQTAEVNNQLASLATSGSLAYGTAKSNGRLDKAMSAADQMTKGQLANRGIQAFGDVVSGGLAGGGVGGPMGAIGGVIAGGSKALSDNADIVDPTTRQSFISAQYAQNRGTAMSNALAPNAFKVSLQDALMGKAGGRLGAMEASSGYGNNGSAQLRKNFGQGAARGFGQGEVQQMTAGLGQSGLIGSERTNINPLMQMQRQGLATAGESTGGAAQMGSVLNNQTKVMKVFQKSMEDGVKIGIEKSLVKDLVMATTSIAGMGTSRISGMADIMSDLKGILSGKDASNIGKQDVADAVSVAQAQKHLMQGGGTAQGEAMQYIDSQQSLKESGFDMSKIGVNAKMILGRTTSREEVMGNQQLMDTLSAADTNGDALAKFLGTGNNDNVKKTHQLGMLRMMAPMSPVAAQMSTAAGLDEFQAGFGKNATAEQAAKSKKQFNELAMTGQAAGIEGFGNAQQSAMSMQALTGQELTGTQKKTIADSDKSPEGAMARFGANLDNLRDKLALSDHGFDQMKAAMDTTIKNLSTLADVANGAQTPMEKLDTTMLMLAKAVQANTEALTGDTKGAQKDLTTLGTMWETATTRKGWQDMLFGKHDNLEHPDDIGSLKGPNKNVWSKKILTHGK